MYVLMEVMASNLFQRMKKVLLLIILLPLLFSCRTAKDLEKNTEIKEIIKERHDTLTVHTRDSIYFSVIQKGDTVFNTKYIEKSST